MELNEFFDRQVKWVRNTATKIREFMRLNVLHRIDYFHGNALLRQSLEVARRAGVAYARDVSAFELRAEIEHLGSFGR